MQDPQPALVELVGSDPFHELLSESEDHQRGHSCGLFPAGPAVMQLASMFVRATGARKILDLGCGIGYSTAWLADAAGTGSTVIAIDSDPGHVEVARSVCARLGFQAEVTFVSERLPRWSPPLKAPSMRFTTTRGSPPRHLTWEG